jgi:hypothetical protein
MSGVAAYMGSRETGLFSDVMDKQKPGLHIVLKVFPINPQLDLVHEVPARLMPRRHQILGRNSTVNNLTHESFLSTKSIKIPFAKPLNREPKNGVSGGCGKNCG